MSVSEPTPLHPSAAPGVQEILNQIDSAERDVLLKPSALSDRERILVGSLALMGVELNHSEMIEQAILRWLPQLRASVATIGEHVQAQAVAAETPDEKLTRELEDAHARIKNYAARDREHRAALERLQAEIAGLKNERAEAVATGVADGEERPGE